MRMHQNLPFFMEQNGTKWPLFGVKIVFFGLSQAVEDLPTPILRVLDAKSMLYGDTDRPNTIYSMLTT